jgi:hypothetical protein
VTPEQAETVIGTLFAAQRDPAQMRAIALMRVSWPWYPSKLMFVMSDFNWLTMASRLKAEEGS